MEKSQFAEENIIHLLLNHPLKSKRLGIRVREEKNKIIALLSKVLLVITLIENVQMFVKNFYIKPSNDFGYRYYT